MMYRAFWDKLFLLSGYLFSYSHVQENSTSLLTTMEMTPITPTTITNTPATTVRRKFLAAAPVHSHFADCPDSHHHFCFHGICRFLILEQTPACVCHPGFIGMRCEHADLLAVVASNQRQQTLATILLGILGSILLVLLCTIINCWWRQGRCRRGSLLSCLSKKQNGMEKPEMSCCHSETVV